MKHHITPNQAKEVTESQFYSLFTEIVHRRDWANYHHKKMTIGKMIECLGEVSIKGNPTARIFKATKVTANGRVYLGKELADALWLAVKDKLERG